MIRIYLGRLGSAKTVSTVREIIKDESNRVTYTNINIRHTKNVKKIVTENLIKKTLISEVKKRDGTIEKNYKFEFNMDFC